MIKDLAVEHILKKYSSTPEIHTYKSDGIYLEGYGGLWSNFVPINPSGKTYQYDIICSIDAGNMFYFGWERYDKDYTSRSNNACIYVINVKPTTDQKYIRYKGTVNLATDGVNAAAFIRLRVLNKWSNSTSSTTGKAIIHSWSLREIPFDENIQQVEISKKGQIIIDNFRETNQQKAFFSKNGFVDSQDFYEY